MTPAAAFSVLLLFYFFAAVTGCTAVMGLRMSSSNAGEPSMR
jgi:hypothetical protein